MPITAASAEHLAADLTEVYAAAELRILEQLARRLARGIDSPSWHTDKILELQLHQRILAGDLTKLERTVADRVAATLATAYVRGEASAVADLLKLDRRPTTTLPVFRQVALLVTETTQQLKAVDQRILRAVSDVYREVIRQAAPGVLTGTDTTRTVVQRALNDFARRGVTGFTDRRGRNWNLTSYTEMAVRSAAGRAAVDGHHDRLLAEGLDLVIVSDAAQECSVCRPWEGKILSLSGATRIDGVRVAGTLAEARAAGFMHPNCRHNTSLYQPGVTRAPAAGSTEDPQGDADRQRLRALERQVRAAKMQQAAAITPEARAEAAARVRAAQARIREHVATSSAKRQPHREQIS